MCKLRERNPQGIVNQHLPGSIGKVFLCPDYMGNAHFMIVHNNRKVVCWDSVGFYNYKIPDTAAFKGHLSPHQIIDLNGLLFRDTEPDYGPAPLSFKFLTFLLR